MDEAIDLDKAASELVGSEAGGLGTRSHGVAQRNIKSDRGHHVSE